MIKLVLLLSLILFNTSHAMLFAFIDSPRPLDEKITLIQSLTPIEMENYINRPNEHGDTPLLHLCKKEFQNREDQTRLAQLLIEKGADINARTNRHNTALHLAVVKSNISLVTLICSKKPKTQWNKAKVSPYALAYDLNKIEMLKIIGPGATLQLQ